MTEIFSDQHFSAKMIEMSQQKNRVG